MPIPRKRLSKRLALIAPGLHAPAARFAITCSVHGLQQRLIETAFLFRRGTN